MSVKHFTQHFTRGFTLIELLVVISIMGILSGIVLVGLDGARVGGRDSERISDLKNIQLALSLYYNDNGHYPCRLDDTSVQGNIYCQPQFYGNYISTLPVDPTTGNVYFYTAMARTSAGTLPPVSCAVAGTTNTLSAVSFYHLGAVVENPDGSYMGQDDLYVMDSTGRITIAGSTYMQCSTSAYGFFHSDAAGCTANDPNPSTPDSCYSLGPF